MLATSILFNGQFAHHKSILLTLLASHKADEREMAINIIFGIRERGPVEWDTPTGVQPFKIFVFIIVQSNSAQTFFNQYINANIFQRGDHQINMKATSLQNLNVKNIKEAFTEPPHTWCLSGSELVRLMQEPLVVDLPVSSMAVERGIKEVTEAAVVCSDSVE